MFCPKCGQQQLSESVHFCSRCGFKLNSLAEPLTKRLIMTAMSLVLTMFALTGFGSITSGPGYMRVRVVVTLIAAIILYLMFSRDLKRIFHKLFSQNIEQPKQVTFTGQDSALPPAQGMPVPMLGSHRVNTAEIVPPPSVTEQTTGLLDKNKY